MRRFTYFSTIVVAVCVGAGFVACSATNDSRDKNNDSRDKDNDSDKGG